MISDTARWLWWLLRRTFWRSICVLHGGHTWDLDEWGVEYPQVVDDVGPTADILWFYCSVCGKPFWSMPLDSYPDADQIREILDGFEPDSDPVALSGFHFPHFAGVIVGGLFMWWVIIRLVAWLLT